MTISNYDRLLQAYNSRDQKQINKVASELILDGTFITDSIRVSANMDTEAFWWWLNTLEPNDRQEMIDLNRACIFEACTKAGFILGEDFSGNPDGTVSCKNRVKNHLKNLTRKTGGMFLHFVV